MQRRCSLGEWRLGAGTQHYYHYVFQLSWSVILPLPSLNQPSARTNAHRRRHGEQLQILLFPSNAGTTAAAINIRHSSPASDAIDCFLAMPHNTVDHSKSKGFRFGEPDQSLSPPRQGCVTPIHTARRDALQQPDSVTRSEDALQSDVQLGPTCYVEERERPLCSSV